MTERCNLCGQRVSVNKADEGTCSYIGEERNRAFVEAARCVLANKGKCITDAACRALADEIRKLKEQR